MKKNNGLTVHVVGAGLAGSECALQLAANGFQVVLYEMRPLHSTPAHKTADFAELVCSNSFGSTNETSAPGQLKWEAAKLNSFILKAAQLAQVPAGQALGIDRAEFSKLISKWIQENPNIKIINKRISSLAELPRPLVIATGPLTDPQLASDLQQHFGNEFLYFFDAIAPIISADSIDYETAWFADRYDKGTPDYLNCPLNKEEYNHLIAEINLAEKITPKDFEITECFEGCMPIEIMVSRGPQTLRFGPMKPVGLINPKTGRIPFAVVQLRKENREGTSYNMVGFQTRMTYSEQGRVFRQIPGLQNAEFLKLGSIHRNLFVNTPQVLTGQLASKKDSQLFFCGQMTGVEGYFESTCTGILVSLFVEQELLNRSMPRPPRHSAFGSLLHTITDPERVKHFQPTNINMGLFPAVENERDKQVRKAKQIALARTAFLDWKSAISGINQLDPGARPETLAPLTPTI